MLEVGGVNLRELRIVEIREVDALDLAAEGAGERPDADLGSGGRRAAGGRIGIHHGTLGLADRRTLYH